MNTYTYTFPANGITGQLRSKTLRGATATLARMYPGYDGTLTGTDGTKHTLGREVAA